MGLHLHLDLQGMGMRIGNSYRLPPGSALPAQSFTPPHSTYDMKHTMSDPMWLWSIIIFITYSLLHSSNLSKTPTFSLLNRIAHHAPHHHRHHHQHEHHHQYDQHHPRHPHPFTTLLPLPPLPRNIHPIHPRHYSQYRTFYIFAIIYPPPSPSPSSSPSPQRTILSTGRLSHCTKYSRVKRIKTSSIDGFRHGRKERAWGLHSHLHGMGMGMGIPTSCHQVLRAQCYAPQLTYSTESAADHYRCSTHRQRASYTTFA